MICKPGKEVLRLIFCLTWIRDTTATALETYGDYMATTV